MLPLLRCFSKFDCTLIAKTVDLSRNLFIRNRVFLSLVNFSTTPFHNKFSSDDLKSIETFKRFIQVDTFNSFWEDVKKGVSIDVEYIDTQSSLYTQHGVVLALHDLTTSNTDLLPVILPLAKLGYRVIAPNFPGSGLTKFITRSDKYIYTGSTDEKAILLYDFLRSIQVDRIDCVVGHGFGCYSALALTAEFSKSLPVKSLALLCPMSSCLSKAHGNFRLFRFISMLWDIIFLRPFVFPILIIMKQMFGHSSLTTLQFSMAMRALMGSQLEQVQANLVQTGWLKIPASLVFCTQDDRVSEADSRDIANMLGISEKDIITIGKTTLVNENPGTIPRAVCIEDSSHDVIQDYQSHIVFLLLDQLKCVRT